MSEQRYKMEDLQEYTGILTSPDARGEKFKMELKVEDNPIMKRWTQKNESTESAIELEFRYNFGPSLMFFPHNIHACRIENCNECEGIRKIYDKFEANLYHLQFGDTFKIRAALINNDRSVLPGEVHNFENYQPLLAAGTESPLRLPDTPEGIKKKYELEQQRLQQEQEKKANEEQAQKDAKRTKREESIKQFLGKSPNTNQIIVTVIGTTIANQIPNIIKFAKYIYRLFVSSY